MMVEPLALSLTPHMPVRTPREGRPTALYGYHLRLVEGPVVTSDDPLLEAFGASVEAVEETNANSEPLQSDGFDPGRPVRLVREGTDEDGDEVIGVWDNGEIRRAGTLPYGAAARVAAATDHGLAIEALIVSEIRLRASDRRCGIALLVYPSALVSVDIAAGGPLQRPESRARPRLVLLADEADGLRWWDPSGVRGPMELGALPVSSTLADELEDLAAALQHGPSDDWESRGFFEDVDDEWQRQALARRTREVWDRVRRELGRRYAIGLMLKGMSHPAWSPEEFEADDDEDKSPF